MPEMVRLGYRKHLINNLLISKIKMNLYTIAHYSCLETVCFPLTKYKVGSFVDYHHYSGIITGFLEDVLFIQEVLSQILHCL